MGVVVEGFRDRVFLEMSNSLKCEDKGSRGQFGIVVPLKVSIRLL